MSELKVNKVSPRSGTTLTIGDSGDTTNIVGTLNNNGATLLSLANGVDNRVITSSSATALNGEANLTFDGSTLGVNGAAIFNESGADKDFRVESDGNANMLFVDGGNNRVGVGTASPSEVLEVVGTVKATTGLTVISSGTEANLRLQNSTTGSGGSDGLLIQATGSDVYINNYENADMYFRTNNTDRLKLHENGVLSAANGIALGVGTANTASNVLSDYEEGTWSPAITTDGGGGNSGVTYGDRYGTYTKIGRVVTVHAFMNLDAVSSFGTGNVIVSTLPFSTNADSQYRSAISIGFAKNWDQAPSGATISSNTNVIYLRKKSTSSALENLVNIVQVGDMNNNSELILSATYETD